jgi:hypothetical protein
MALPNPLTYNAWLTRVSTIAVYGTSTVSGVVTPVDPQFASVIPDVLNYAEMRIQRDLDLQGLTTSNTYTVSGGQKILQIPVNDFVTIQQITTNIPATTQTQTLEPTSREFITQAWNDTSQSGTPQQFAMIGGDLTTFGATSNNILLGPTPDQSYTFTVYGTVRASSLYTFANPSSANTVTTLISSVFPDLLLMASMIFISGYQRNFSAQSGDPQMAQTYETQYQMLKAGAMLDEQRKKQLARAYSSFAPTPSAAVN